MITSLIHLVDSSRNDHQLDPPVGLVKKWSSGRLMVFLIKKNKKNNIHYKKSVKAIFVPIIKLSYMLSLNVTTRFYSIFRFANNLSTLYCLINFGSVPRHINILELKSSKTKNLEFIDKFKVFFCSFLCLVIFMRFISGHKRISLQVYTYLFF